MVERDRIILNVELRNREDGKWGVIVGGFPIRVRSCPFVVPLN
jgi:hypothetical protein